MSVFDNYIDNILYDLAMINKIDDQIHLQTVLIRHEREKSIGQKKRENDHNNLDTFNLSVGPMGNSS